MEPSLKYLDQVLAYLETHKGSFIPPTRVLNDLEIPLGEIGTIIQTLSYNEHVELQVKHYKPSFMKITDKGVDFIHGLGYQKGYGVADVKLHRVMILEGDVKEMKEKMEIDIMKLSLINLQNQVNDYPKGKQRANIAIGISILAVIVSIALEVIKRQL